MSTAPFQNPYVGPRPFKTGETLYGRDREILELLDLLIAERIVLLYSPSGAGKTSLIQAGLLPELVIEDFQPLSVMRVSLEPPPEQVKELPSGYNHYILSAIMSLEEGVPENQQFPLTDLVGMTLAEYLERRKPTPDPSQEGKEPTLKIGQRGAHKRLVLIFDQFEEILTIDPTDRTLKTDFFAQIGDVLRNSNYYALFAMREEFPAALDPYLRLIPTRFSTRFRLNFLDVDSAAQAMQRPAAQAGTPFTETAVKKLIDDLRTVRVQRPDGSMTHRLGRYVEPVQLQVVCHRVWNHLPDDATMIEEAHIQKVGDVNAALGGYYADCVQAAAEQTGVRKRVIREWVHSHLITGQGVRGQVLRGKTRSQGLDNRVIAHLVDAHLIRAESRRGALWYELAHDRLIEPVHQDNARWFEAYLSPLQRQAILWDAQNRPNQLLFSENDLRKANTWADENPDALLSVDQDFLAACQNVHPQIEQDDLLQKTLRVLPIPDEEKAVFQEKHALLSAGVVIAMAVVFMAGFTLAIREVSRTAPIMAIIMAVFPSGAVLWWIFSLRAKKKNRMILSQVLQQQGFLPSTLALQDLTTFHLINKMTSCKIRYSLTGTRRQVRCTIVEFTHTTGEDRSSAQGGETDVSYTSMALYFPVEGWRLPEFCARPTDERYPDLRPWISKSIRLSEPPTLSNQYTIWCRQEDVEAVTQYLTRNTFLALEQYGKALHISSSRQGMLIYQQNVVPYKSVLQYIDSISDIFLTFQAGGHV